MELTQTSRHPAINIIIFLALILAMSCISLFWIWGTLYPFTGNPFNILENLNSCDINKYIFLYSQGVYSIITFTITPILFIKYFYKKRFFFFKSIPNEIILLSSCLLVIVAWPTIELVAEFNQKMHFPEFLKTFEAWALLEEGKAKILTVCLTKFNSNIEFGFGLLVFALFAAIGEELTFRGIIQTNLQDWFKNKHYAIWVAAFIFSAIHMQFYGFLPRLLLGALFGYFYVWTGNMLVPMLGHFTNNAFTVFLIHMKNQNKVKIDLESTKDLPLSMIIGSALIFGVFLWFFKSQLDAQKNKTQSLSAIDDDL